MKGSTLVSLSLALLGGQVVSAQTPPWQQKVQILRELKTASQAGQSCLGDVLSTGATAVLCEELIPASDRMETLYGQLLDCCADSASFVFMGEARPIAPLIENLVVAARETIDVWGDPSAQNRRIELASQFVAWTTIAELMLEELPDLDEASPAVAPASDTDSCVIVGSVPIKIILSCAENGIAEAQRILGFGYERGLAGLPKDAVEASRWYRLAAEQGNVEAQYTLGARYYQGKGVQEDNVLAYMWYTLAEAQGHQRAQNGKQIVVTVMTSEQIGEAQKLAREWLERHR